MEQPRYRETAADEGSNGPGWSPEPPGSGGGGSAAWNGSCGLGDATDLPFAGPGCTCRYQGEPAAPLSPERRDGSCSLSCHHRDTAAPPEPPGPGEEDGASEEGAGKSRRTRRRQRQRSGKEESGRREGKRQRPVRKRSRGDDSELPGPVEEPAGCQGLLARGLLARARRLGAEAGGWLLCSCCRLGTGDLCWARAGVRGWGRRVGQRARSSCLRAARWLRAGAGLFLRLLWMLCALLLLLLMLLLGSLRLCWRLGAAALATGAHRLGSSRQVARLLALLDVAVLRRTWGLLGESRTCRYLWDWLQRRRAPPWAAGGDGLGAGGAPAGSEEEVSRLLAMAEVPEEELNPFQVLGVEATASETELKKAYRRLAVLVHPDKNQHPRAEAAFKVLRAAWDIISSPERRKEYEMKRMAESELTRSMSEFLSRLQDDLKEAMNTMMCSKCQGKHKRFEMDRDPLSARYCAECGVLHPAEEGDFWAESSLLGLKITYFAMMEGKIYDITEWAGCQRVGISPDTHRVPYHISFGARNAGPAGRQRSASKGSPTSAADLQDFFTRVFQGSSGAMPGGPFPPPPAPPAAASPPGAPPRAEGAVPKGEAKHKRRKKVRRPFQR
ncbi:dnaJ homolog subfamily C member 14 [Rissa tridactyla]|uniref:dnaJ homolog subfamily C member 14 n=1 Tax=Rissa tridactyla TaxID=75485 RepID=UPI0023BB11A9|nr:dnaJ homolog subfamily C member 14 [Rissa tridactyla]